MKTFFHLKITLTMQITKETRTLLKSKSIIQSNSMFTESQHILVFIQLVSKISFWKTSWTEPSLIADLSILLKYNRSAFHNQSLEEMSSAKLFQEWARPQCLSFRSYSSWKRTQSHSPHWSYAMFVSSHTKSKKKLIGSQSTCQRSDLKFFMEEFQCKKTSRFSREKLPHTLS